MVIDMSSTRNAAPAKRIIPLQISGDWFQTTRVPPKNFELRFPTFDLGPAKGRQNARRVVRVPSQPVIRSVAHHLPDTAGAQIAKACPNIPQHDEGSGAEECEAQRPRDEDAE